jgi:hypothetical protein
LRSDLERRPSRSGVVTSESAKLQSCFCNSQSDFCSSPSDFCSSQGHAGAWRSWAYPSPSAVSQLPSRHLPCTGAKGSIPCRARGRFSEPSRALAFPG